MSNPNATGTAVQAAGRPRDVPELPSRDAPHFAAEDARRRNRRSTAPFGRRKPPRSRLSLSQVRGGNETLDRALVGQQKPAGSDACLPRAAGSIIADKLFGSAAGEIFRVVLQQGREQGS